MNHLARRFSLFIAFSFLVHLVFLLTVPSLIPPPQLKVIPVTLISRMDLYLTPREMRELWETPWIEEVKKELIWERLSTFPPLNLPVAEVKEGPKVRLEDLLPLPVGREPVAQPKAPSKVPSISPPREGPLERIIASLEKTEPKRKVKKPKEPELSLGPLKLGIKGPVAKRKILYIPPPPKAKITVEAEVIFKFWVKPDGTVGRVIPLMKGDAQLEMVAIEHIKQYRFNPLPPDVPQVEMWGTISVKSVLK
ncbi:MAG: hypothetical protein DRG32_01735 [Deltaproteobacteria bacterium]|nr:MAG: hypothetical protein DRG32_01735 [Deltaproteobacteria bacterium]